MHRLFLSVGLVTSLTASLPGLAQTKVAADEMSLHAAEYADRTLTIEDRFMGLSKFSLGIEKELGFRPDDYFRFYLHDSDLTAFLSKTPESEALMKGLEFGTPLTVTGVLRVETRTGAHLTELDIRLPNRTTMLFDVNRIKVGWDKPLPYAHGVIDDKHYVAATPRELVLVPERHAGKNVKVTAKVGPSLNFSRNFSTTEREAGLTQRNTIKLATLSKGLVYYVEKTPENVDLILGLSKGDTLIMHGHLVAESKQTRGEQDYMFIVDRLALE